MRFTILLLMVCNLLPLYSQSLDTLRLIDEVVVTAPSLVKDFVPMQHLSGANLSELSVHSVADALRYFSGLQIKDYGGIGGLKTVDVRSLGSQHLGVFYNGIQLSNSQNGVIDLGRFSLENLELVSLYNGQQTSPLQSAQDYASSNTLHLKSHRPHLSFNQRNKVKLSLDIGSFLTINPKFSWGHLLYNGSTLSLSGEGIYSSGRYPFRYQKAGGYNVSTLRENGDVTALRSELTWWKSLTKGELFIHTYFYSSNRGYPGAAVREEPGVFKNQDRQWDINTFIQGNLKVEQKHYRMQARFKYAYDYLHYLSDPRLDVSAMYIDNRFHQQELYLSLAQSIRHKGNYFFSLSNDIKYNYLQANLPEFVFPKRLQILSALASTYRGKYLRLQTSLLHTYALDTRVVAPQYDDFHIWSPTLQIAYFPFGVEWFNLRVFYKHSYRLPSLGDLYYDFIGGKHLNPELTEQLNLGVHFASGNKQSIAPKYELQADIYYNRVKDKIVAIPTSNQFRWTMLNYGLVDIYGIDISAKGEFHIGKLNFTPRLTYTYQKALEHTDSASPWYGGQIPYAPKHAGSFTLRFSYREWLMNYSFLYTGERYHSIANLAEYHIQPWYTHDLSLGRTWYLRGSRQLKTTIEINNLLNQQYEVIRNYPMPGINFKLKLQLYV